jgi:predicted AAA+ superfamily ATPase
VIDEVQRAPDLVLAIKHSVDENPRPGRFLLTGSANLLTIATVRESLAGRIEIVPLYPLSRSERQRIKRRSERRRQDWYRAYIDSIVQRDLPEIADLAKAGHIPRVLEIAARFAGQLTNFSEIGRSAGIDHKTADQYLRVLEQLYLIQRVQPWYRNELSRLVKTPKLHFIDSGLLTAMRGYSIARIRKDRSLFGPLLEGFVFSELLKRSSWMDERISLFHYRDRDQFEVDFVLEDSAGAIVGVEVKAAASVTRQDFGGLQRLASAAGDSFVQGILLDQGEQTLSFAENLRAVPLPALWA